MASTTSLFSRLKKSLRAPRQLSLTRAGKFFLLITLAVGFGAINTGNNLLFLLFGMLLSLVLASGLLSEAVIRHVLVRRRTPRRLFAGEPAPGGFRILNQGSWPSLSIVASEQNPRSLRGPLRGQSIGPSPIPWWKFWRRQTDQDVKPVAATYCLRADRREETPLDTLYCFPARGEYFIPGVALTTRFPFGLFEKSRRFDDPTSLLVYPRSETSSPWLGQLDSRFGETSRNQRGQGEEFFGLRDYRPGEDRRSIHWKSSARRGEPVVREHESLERRALLIVLDNRIPKGAPGVYSKLFETGLERLTGLLQGLRSRGYRIELLTTDGHVQPSNPGDIEPLLAHLAVIELLPPTAPGPTTHLENFDPSLSLVYLGFEDQRPPGSTGLFLSLRDDSLQGDMSAGGTL